MPHPAPPCVVFLNLLPDNRQVQIRAYHPQHGEQLLSPGVNYWHPYLNVTGLKKFIYPFLATSKQSFALPPNTVLLVNQSVNADHYPQGLQRVLQELRRYPKLPVMNAPEAIAQSTREQVYQKLHDVPGLLVPKTVRCAPRSRQDLAELIEQENLNYPVVLRPTAQVLGAKQHLLKNAQAVQEHYASAFNGQDFYLTQFIDSAQAGLYQRYRFVLIEGELYFHHHWWSQDWQVNFHNRNRLYRSNPEHFIALEQESWQNFESEIKAQVQEPLRQAAERLHLDCLGIDCAPLPDGRWLLFECSATTATLHNPTAQQEHDNLGPPLKQIIAALEQACHNKAKLNSGV